MAGRRVADWRFPTPKQERVEDMKRTMAKAAAPPSTPAVGPADPMPDAYWDNILNDPGPSPARGEVRTPV